MIWTPEPAPLPNSQRTMRRFAVLPVDLTNGDRVWLAWYYDVQRWTACYDYVEGESLYSWATVARSVTAPPACDCSTQTSYGHVASNVQTCLACGKVRPRSPLPPSPQRETT